MRTKNSPRAIGTKPKGLVAAVRMSSYRLIPMRANRGFNSLITPMNVLQKLDHFSGQGATHRQHFTDHLLIKGQAYLFTRDRTFYHHLGNRDCVIKTFLGPSGLCEQMRTNVSPIKSPMPNTCGRNSSSVVPGKVVLSRLSN